MNAADEIQRLLGHHQAVLVRHNEHRVYRLPNGQNFVVAEGYGKRQAVWRKAILKGKGNDEGVRA